MYVQIVTISSWLNFGGPAPWEGGLRRGGGNLALPYYSHRGLCASMGGLRRARSVCVSLSAYLFIYLFIRQMAAYIKIINKR